MEKEEFSLAEPIKAVLRNHNVSQKELAERLGKSYIGIRQMIARDMRISSLFAIADAIGCSPKEFFETDEPQDLLTPTASVKVDDDGSYIFQCPHCGHKTKFRRTVAFTEEK